MIFYACPYCQAVLPVTGAQALALASITCSCGRTRRANDRDILRTLAYRP